MRLAAAFVVIATIAAPARADKADKLFEKAKKLHAEKKFAEACPTYEEVDKAAPAIGSKLNIAKCYEDWGRLATAYVWYLEADTVATAAKDPRAPKIKELIAELDTNVPRMTIKVPEGADPDILDTITLDGQPLAEDWINTEQRIDPGPHVIEFTVEGQKKKKMAPVERGGESELSLDIPKGAGKKARPPKKKEDQKKVEPIIVAPMDPGRKRRLLAYGVGGGGVLVVGIASIVTLAARSTYKDALSDHCMGSTSGCDPTGLRITHDMRTRANVATVFTIIGVAAIGAGVALYLTAPKTEPAREKPPMDKPVADKQVIYVSPTIDASGGGFVVGGTF